MNKNLENEDQNNQKKYNFQAEISTLLHILAKNLYSDREIFLRELISNAADALSKLKFESLTKPELSTTDNTFKINITLDEKTSTFSISDSGIGMSEQELINNLGTIAKSGTSQFLKEISSSGEKAAELIGKFGIGFYSVFMVTEMVTVETLSAVDPKKQAFKWTSDGLGAFHIEASTKKEPGTTISFVFNQNSADIAHNWRIEQIVQQHSNFTPFDIELNGKVINQKEALWVKSKNKITPIEYNNFFKFLSHQTEDPLLSYHFNSDAPLQFNSILFVSQKSNSNLLHKNVESNIQLYCKKILIQDNCKEILPPWLRFIYGVVDSHDLPLNISRQNLQENLVIKKIQTFLIKKLLQEWQNLKINDNKKFFSFWENFGIFLKEGLYSDFSQRDSLINLYHSYTSLKHNELTSLDEYVKRMPTEQKEIYYISGTDIKKIESSPNLEYFKKNDIEVLYLFENFDEFVINAITKFKDFPLVSVDKADIEATQTKSTTENSENKSPETSEVDARLDKFKNYLKDILGDKVLSIEKSHRLVDSPCTLVSPKDAFTAGMEKIMKIMNENFDGGKRILEINFEHQIFKNLLVIHQKLPQDKIIKDTIDILLEHCLLNESNTNNDPLIFSKISEMLKRSTSLYISSLESN